MSRKMRDLIRAPIRNTLLPRTILHAGVAGVVNATLGGSTDATRIAQEGFARGSWKQMTVRGLDAAGVQRDKVVYRVSQDPGNRNELVSIVDDDGVDYVTRTDAGMAEGLRHTKARFDRRGLTAHTDFEFTDAIKHDPERFAREQAALGTVSCLTPDTAHDHDLRRVASVTPAKDRSQTLDIYWGKRRR